MKFVLTRLCYAVVIIVLVSIVTFYSMHASPGSVVSSVFNLATTPHSVIVAYERRHGLLDPLPVQYWHFMTGLLSGNFGTSLVSNLSVKTIVANSAGYTALLAGSAFVLIFGVGIPIGVLAAIKRDSWFDRGVRAFSSIVLAIPNFVLGIILILVLGIHLHVLPVAGAGSFSNLVLPAIVLAAAEWSLTVRVTRTSFLEQLSADFTRTLRARGVSERRIQWRHVLRNSMGPIISLGIIEVRNLLGYTLIVEVIFRWPGLGTELVQSVLQRDYDVTEVLSLLLAAAVVLASAFGDIALSLVDPRVRVTGEHG
ncbi:MAG: glutathione transporter permease GsiC [Acidimicrobiaceae bacterium]|nr:glutathione transporter permease GsiC [Acidimicrobiaceae bacterium]